jgi:hypothetical protein
MRQFVLPIGLIIVVATIFAIAYVIDIIDAMKP